MKDLIFQSIYKQADIEVQVLAQGDASDMSITWAMCDGDYNYVEGELTAQEYAELSNTVGMSDVRLAEAVYNRYK